MRALLELLPLYLAMPGFAFGFGFGPQGPRATAQGTYTPPSTPSIDFSDANNSQYAAIV